MLNLDLYRRWIIVVVCEQSLIATALLTFLPSFSQAELIVEPVFNRVAGTGAGESAVGVKQAVNGVQTGLGLEPLWNGKPGEIFSYVSGNPRNLALDNLAFYNDVGYDVTGFSLAIVGTGTDTDDPTTIVRGPIDARFGDVDGDGLILSDIFGSFSISADGKQIDFTDGLIQPGERYTGIHLASSDITPTLAAIDSWMVPEPSGAVLSLFGLALLSCLRKR